MSVRAYKVITKTLKDEASFNMWHDKDLLDFFEKEGHIADQRNEDGQGQIELSVEVLQRAIDNYKWETSDYRQEAILEDIADAKKAREEYVLYECF